MSNNHKKKKTFYCDSLLVELEFQSFSVSFSIFHDSAIIIILENFFFNDFNCFLAGVIFECLHKDNVEPCQLLMAVVKIDEKKWN